MRRGDFGNSRYWVSLAGVITLFLVDSGGVLVVDSLVLRVGRFPKRRVHHILEDS
jgi:hypothetical protein